MYKYLFSFFCLIIASISTAYSQITYSPEIKSKNNDCIIEKVELTNDETIVTIKVPRSRRWGTWIKFSSATILAPMNERALNMIRETNLGFPGFLPSSEYSQLYTSVIQQIKDNMGDLGDDVEIDVDTGAIQFNSEEAVDEFKSQFESAFAGIDSSTMFANFFENVDVTAGADKAAQNAVNEFTEAVNGALSTTNIAWFDSIGTAGEQLGASLDVPIEKATTLQSKTTEQKEKWFITIGISTIEEYFKNK